MVLLELLVVESSLGLAFTVDPDHEAGKLARCAGLCLCPQERRVRERLPEPPTCSSVHSL